MWSEFVSPASSCLFPSWDPCSSSILRQTVLTHHSQAYPIMSFLAQPVPDSPPRSLTISLPCLSQSTPLLSFMPQLVLFAPALFPICLCSLPQPHLPHVLIPCTHQLLVLLSFAQSIPVLPLHPNFLSDPYPLPLTRLVPAMYSFPSLDPRPISSPSQF